MIKKNLFNDVIYRGTLGAIYGIVVGLILGLLIWALLQISMAIISPAIQSEQTMRSANSPPFEFFITFGMGFAAVIGGIFGAITSLKEARKNN
jgi:cell division protein FtsX